jgi:hypothetical protein
VNNVETLDELLKRIKEKNTVKAPSRNPLVAPQADMAKMVKALLNKYETKKVGKIDSPWNKYGTGHELGSLLFGESPELLDDMSYGLNPLTSGGRTGRIPIPDKRLLDMPVPTPAEGMLGVIKNKGGNWLTGSVENALKGLKKTYGTTGKPVEEILQQLNAKYTPEELARLEPQAATNQWIDGPLVNYIKNSMATPEDPIRLRADKMVAAAKARLERDVAKAQKKYPTPEYEGDVRQQHDIRRAQERYDDEMSGVLHTVPEGWTDGSLLNKKRSNFTYGEKLAKHINDPKELNYGIFGKTEIGKNWEDLSDTMIDYQFGPKYLEHTVDELDPRLGFDHLIDEIGNALSPTSDLPANLRLTPEDLANPRRNSMQSMVDLVARVNQHRRRMAIEAEKKGNEAIRDYPDWNVVKEYPDGYRMVRLPDVADSEEAFKIGKACGEKGGWCTQGDDMLRNYGSGDSRVNLLLDPEGKPVAQVETVKQGILKPDVFAATELPRERLRELVATTGDAEHYRAVLRETPEYQDYLANFKPPISIGQIKGKHNAKPKAEHIPYLQDFVKSGNFSDVSDLDNVDMFRSGSSYTTREDMIKEPGFVDFMIERNLNPIDDGDFGRGLNYWNNNRQIGIDGI